MHFDKQTFLTVIDATPFVSLDLVVLNERREALLGYRRNRPAQNSWFVPGGRIRKNEKTQDALQRICQAELGIPAGPGRLLGIFDHFYDDNYFNEPGINTHYVACGYAFEIESHAQFRRDDQHTELKWWNIDELLCSPEVHPNSKLYFNNSLENGFRCNCG